MLEFIAGLGAGTVAWMAVSFALASRKDRKAREQMQRLAALKQAEYDVQDAAVLLVMDPPDAGEASDEAQQWHDLRHFRDRAAAAYFAAL